MSQSPHPEHHLASAAMSPPQHSPATPQSSFPFPPTKRPRLSSPGAAPQSPLYAGGTPSIVSPGSSTVTTPTTASLQLGNPTPLQTSNAPAAYTNGHLTPVLTLPEARRQVAALATSQPMMTSPSALYTTATLTPVSALTQQSALSPATPGTMGPPLRPPDKPQKEYEYDVTDSLAGTGIDIRAEEQYMSELYSLDPQGAEARTGFAQHPVGSKATLSGAGPLNQPPHPTSAQSQSQLVAQRAEKAWTDASTRLAMSRTQELKDPFLLVSLIHHKAEKIAKDHGLTLNLDIKGGQQVGRMRLPHEFGEPQVTVTTKVLPDAAVVLTTGSWIPHDAYLADQLALMSIASKHRLRMLLEDANRIAKNRQISSHGDIPEEWQIAAAPLPTHTEGEQQQQVDAVPDSAISPSTNPLKRPFGSTTLSDSTLGNPSKLQKVASNSVILTTREAGRGERDLEEQRLRRRNTRRDGTADAGSAQSRAGSIAPGTPGSVAPDPGPKKDGLSKKEQKKSQAKTLEAASHAIQNTTSSLFAGFGGGSLFGKKKKGKTYDWMNAASAGSGANTPSRAGTPVAGRAGPGAPGPTLNLTADGRNRLGNWREDKEKGRNIQLRDWIVVLEEDGLEGKALQKAYDFSDSATPK